MMERMTSFVLVCSLGQYIPEALKQALPGAEAPITGDHGPIKVELASARILGRYNEILSRPKTAGLREGPLVLQLAQEILDNSSRMDPLVVDSLTRIHSHLSHFMETSPHEPRGDRLRRLYKDLHVAGPYYCEERYEHVLGEFLRFVQDTFKRQGYQKAAIFSQTDLSRWYGEFRDGRPGSRN